MTGRQDYLKLLLNQQDPFAIGRVLTYYDYLNRARLEQIATIKTTLHHIHTLEQNIEQETIQLETLVNTQQHKQTQLNLNYDQRQDILVQLATLLESQDKELKRLREDKHHLERLLGTLGEVLKDIPPSDQQLPFAQLKGQLPLPVDGKVLNGFNTSLIGHLKWQGILIAAKQGDKVHSVAPGRVAFAQWFRNLGLLIIIDHGHGYMSLYAHNQSLYTKTGLWVDTYETIASVGNSGGRHTHALYFEIRYQGVPIDPQKWLVQTQ
ncbi:MAG: peptidoglycan DD-metalloendopeptidase family protein [Pseudomonadota bacterium]|nr:peptidoglycan DD-metalloendopeptidase family protein [Pseudomonadota bacterium]